MANIARAIWREWGEDHADTVSITAQPICPKCGELGRVSDEYCIVSVELNYYQKSI
jgi:hypothetical protein